MLRDTICRAAQTVISSQCKALFKEAVADSKTGNITVVPAIAILTEEEAEHPRPSSGCCTALRYFLTNVRLH
ncbi:hypothetical protein CVIRNUC_000984 [Coccomyxa viridis]|uniref:Uncharacterized protein n=1 Tax=Coccomyxa viridis TaxID=1274662 RepID=A0AAV1HTF9_9CHLO|nr:hypothetical protein CVIRNUC_000984 [Coccomyxa viridis]